MKRKRRTPLQVLMLHVTCGSLANGQIRVFPTWDCDYKPGVLTRLYAARPLQALINRHLRG